MKRILLYDDYNAEIRDGAVIGTVRQTFASLAFKNGWKIIEIWQTRKDYGTKGGSSQSGAPFTGMPR